MALVYPTNSVLGFVEALDFELEELSVSEVVGHFSGPSSDFNPENRTPVLIVFLRVESWHIVILKHLIR